MSFKVRGPPSIKANIEGSGITYTVVHSWHLVTTSKVKTKQYTMRSPPLLFFLALVLQPTNQPASGRDTLADYLNTRCRQFLS